ncbi:ComF family protein [Xanthobacter sp. KR7-225]|uniref:ComF family protein n=1 Tax=Xanthobacter sp. KR7-225 TaxID=3156613 RepID=UPI0032B3AD68
MLLSSSHLGPAAGALRRLGQSVLGLALPPTCISCAQVTGAEGGLCGTCWSRLAFITRPYCERTGAPFAYDAGAMLSADAAADPPSFHRARAAVVFEGVARDLVHNLKYADRLDLARPMARLMRQAGAELLAEAHVLVPVPLHPLRLWRRRFNQAALLARHIARESGVPARTDLLARTRGTPSQTTLSRAARRANVAGAFAVRGDAACRVAEARVVIVDDVYTTGATLDACARALVRAGAARVDALTFARVVETG